jgi:glucose/arabinose dehydrogenase
MFNYKHKCLNFLLLIALVALTKQVKSAILPPGFVEILIGAQLDPTAMALAPDGRIFVAEKRGRVLVIENGVLQTEAFLEFPVDNFNERGLGGIAVDPNFETNGYIYVYYTVKDQNQNRLSRFSSYGGFGVPASEHVLLEMDSLSGGFHNGGSLAFAADGTLFISVGDGSSSTASQSHESLLGKILRINPDGTIPIDNPFYEQNTGKYRAIYALGFRNPFSIAIDPTNGQLLACDVGGGNWEEVNEVLPGKNYGWPLVEGKLTVQSPPDNYQDPIYAYNHDNGCAIVGAAFYKSANLAFPDAYWGKFFYADYCNKSIHVLNPNSGVPESVFATEINRPLQILFAPDGTMYYIARAGLGDGTDADNTLTDDGTLWRIIYTGNNAPFISVQPEDQLISIGESTSFKILHTGVSPFSYQWQQNGVDIVGANASIYEITDAFLADSGALFRCIVTNIEGADTSGTALLAVTSNQRPNPVILTPTESYLYQAGTFLHFSGMATDPESGDLDPATFTWKVDFYHQGHAHPTLPPLTGVGQDSVLIPNSGETSPNVWYRIKLTATDNQGMSRTVERDVYPLKSIFKIQTDPAGLYLFVDGSFQYTPATMESVVGMIRKVSTNQTQVTDDYVYNFDSWATGATLPYVYFETELDTPVITAKFNGYQRGNGSGLTGRYYDYPDADHMNLQSLKRFRTDSLVQFNWSYSSPDTSQLGVDYYRVHWQGFVETLSAQDYTFLLFADEGVRLWVDNQLIIDDYEPHNQFQSSGTISLDAMTKYPISIEYYEQTGPAICWLMWRAPDMGKMVIPTSQLYPTHFEPTTILDDIDAYAFPNPFNSYIFTSLVSLEPKEVVITLTNAIGQTLFSTQKTITNGQISEYINTETLVPGAYTFRVLDIATGRSKGSLLIKID